MQIRGGGRKTFSPDPRGIRAMVGARVPSSYSRMRLGGSLALPSRAQSPCHLVIDPTHLAVPERGGFHIGIRRGPSHGVFDDAQDVLVVIGREGLVAGTEVDDLAGAA